MQDVLIIAEAGVNHNGSLEMAKQMALAAKNAGADVVKYQTAVPELVVSKFAPKAEYQKARTGDGESQLEMIRRLHFDFEGHRQLKAYCDSIGIQYLSAAFDLPSVEFLKELDLPFFKIPSGEITNLPYLEAVAAAKKPVVLCGDLNVAHNEIDLKNPGPNRGNAGFSDQERAKMTELLAAGFADTFREKYPDLTGAYSWWSYRFNARKNNAGWRIDYFLVSRRVMDKVKTAAIHPEVFGSDHCPVELDIDL